MPALPAEAAEEPSGEVRDRAGERTIVIDQGLWRDLFGLLSADAAERGGILLGHDIGATRTLVAAVLPTQTRASPVYCEFPVAEADRLREVIDVLADRGIADWEDVQSFTWVHTHPGLGVFLSGTDVATLGRWAVLDPAACAIVVDVHARRFQGQFGAFDHEGRRIRASTGTTSSYEDLGDAFRLALNEVYGEAGIEPPAVVVGGTTASAEKENDHGST